MYSPLVASSIDQKISRVVVNEVASEPTSGWP
jgi:hypothetical protein